MERSRAPSRSFIGSIVAAVVAFSATLGVSRVASADDAALWAGAALANAGAVSSDGPQLGAAGQAGAVFSMSDFWGLELGLEGAHHFPASPGDSQLDSMAVQDGWVGVRYNLDVFTYVPYIGASVVLYGRAPRIVPGAPPRPSAGAKLTVGTDWRFQRYWSLGLRADLHAVHLAVADFPNYTTVGLNVAYRFRL